jgi:hypothetical protein
MYHRNSTGITRRDKSCHVANDSSTHGNDERTAVGARANKLAAGFFDSRKVLRGFSVIDQNRGAPSVRKKPFDARSPMPPHARRRNYKHGAILHGASRHARQFPQHASAAQHIVFPVRRLN